MLGEASIICQNKIRNSLIVNVVHVFFDKNVVPRWHSITGNYKKWFYTLLGDKHVNKKR